MREGGKRGTAPSLSCEATRQRRAVPGRSPDSQVTAFQAAFPSLKQQWPISVLKRSLLTVARPCGNSTRFPFHSQDCREHLALTSANASKPVSPGQFSHGEAPPTAKLSGTRGIFWQGGAGAAGSHLRDAAFAPLRLACGLRTCLCKPSRMAKADAVGEPQSGADGTTCCRRLRGSTTMPSIPWAYAHGYVLPRLRRSSRSPGFQAPAEKTLDACFGRLLGSRHWSQGARIRANREAGAIPARSRHCDQRARRRSRPLLLQAMGRQPAGRPSCQSGDLPWD